MENNNSNTKDRELLLTRVLDAPVDLVWEAFSQAGHIANWWGPDGFTNTLTKMEMWAGGKWELVMHGPDGTDYPNESVFREIIPNEKIVYEHISAPHILATITFTPQGDKTLLRWHMVFDSREVFLDTVMMHKADVGLKQNCERLNIYVVNMGTK